MTDWYLAPSLDVLRAEINARWPGRDRTSDGTIGDAAHQASTSDHNPNVRGSVDAADFDKDGIDFPTIFAAIKRHPSSRYVIFERRLYHRLRGWKAEPYSGVNPHDKHFHLSIDQTREAEQDRRPWGLLEEDMTPEELLRADVLPDVPGLQYTVGGAIHTTLIRAGSIAEQVAEIRGDVDALGQAVTALAAKVDQLGTGAPTIDYDQLADAIVRRAVGAGQA